MKQKYYFLQRILLSFFWTVTIIYKLALLKWKKKIKKSIYVIWKIFKEPILHHIKYEKNET